MELSCGSVAGVPAIRPLISRVSILILAAILVSMGVGAHLPTDKASACLIWGSYGLLTYGILEVTAKYRSWRRCFENRERSSHKLDQWITSDLTSSSPITDRTGDSGALKAEEIRTSNARYLLVIDDDSATVERVRTMLRPFRIRVLCCSLPDEASELSRNAGAILCDVKVGEHKGSEIIQDVRRHGYRGPVIMTGTGCSRSAIDTAIRSGIDDFLVKPFSVDILVHRLRRVILRSQTEKQRTREMSA